MSLPAPCRHVLITGATTGIGRACALYLARQGFCVWAGVRTPAEAESLQQAGASTPIPIRTINIEVRDIPSIRAAEAEIRSHVGQHGLYALVNNAGICIVGPVEFISLQDWQQQFDVNFFGAIAVTQIMLPLLRIYNAGHADTGSRIINMGSITGEVSTPLFGAYSASKFALRAMTDALRLELRPEGMHVSLIVPGTIQSEISPARRQYGALINNVAGYVFSCAKNALPADHVAKAVHECLTSAKPNIQYRVGWEAQVGSRAKKIIPDRLFDFLLARKLGVPKKRAPLSKTSSPINEPLANDPDWDEASHENPI
jgi:NAD(P)-dependent dehydrogenase (short-subunit alcohol dehydrogenase family)